MTESLLTMALSLNEKIKENIGTCIVEACVTQQPRVLRARGWPVRVSGEPGSLKRVFRVFCRFIADYSITVYVARSTFVVVLARKPHYSYSLPFQRTCLKNESSEKYQYGINNSKTFRSFKSKETFMRKKLGHTEASVIKAASVTL